MYSLVDSDYIGTDCVGVRHVYYQILFEQGKLHYCVCNVMPKVLLCRVTYCACICTCIGCPPCLDQQGTLL